jgi:hypothetical protein
VNDPITLGAENDTLRQELARARARVEALEAQAIPPTERETGRDHDAAFLARVYCETDKVSTLLSDLVRHLKGRIDGLGVDAAQSQAFEARTSAALNSIEGAIRLQSGILDRISVNQTLIIQEIRQHGRRIGELEGMTRPTMFDQLSPL